MEITEEINKLKSLFQKEGIGIMATCGEDGWVNMAIYSPPLITPDGLLVFGATNRLTYKNLTQNPKAMFMFIRRDKWEGVRIRLVLVKEENSGPMLGQIRERFRQIGYYALASEICHALYFRAEQIWPLKKSNTNGT